MAQPGPIYDDAAKVLCRLFPDSLCRMLGVPVQDGARPLQLSPTLPSFSQQVDALLAIGSTVALHIEFQAVGVREFALRMLEYWVRLRRVPDLAGLTIHQHAVVLGKGRVDSHLRAHGLDYRCEVHYLRDRPVTRFLLDPSLAPFAALTRLSGAERPEALRAALELIATVSDDVERQMLRRATLDLAKLRLDTAIIDAIWKESDMPVPSFTREIEEKGREDLVRSFLVVRFGDDERVDAVASRLARHQPAEIAKLVESAGSLDDLI